jgi:PAS domain-containing protein
MLIKPLDQSYRKESRLGATLITIFAATIMVVLLAQIVIFWPGVFELRFSWYAVLSGVAVLTNLALLALVIRRKESFSLSIRYILPLLGLALLGLSETMQRLSVLPEIALFWRDLTLISALLTPIAILLFVYNYTGRHRMQHYMWAAILVGITTVLLCWIGVGSNMIFVHDPTQMINTFYGYEVPLGPSAPFYFMWIQGLMLTSLIELIRYARLQPSGPKHLQAQLFIFAVGLIVITSFVVDGLLPFLNIIILPMASVFGSIAALIIAYAVALKTIFSVNPATVVNTILDTMADAVIVTDTDFTVIYSNKFTAVHLQVPEYKMVGRNMSEFLEENTYTKITKALMNYQAEKQIALIDQGEMKTDNYEQRYVDISLSKVMENAQLVGYIFSFANSSEPKFRADMEERMSKPNTTSSSVV